jgi:transposase InsO family protein
LLGNPRSLIEEVIALCHDMKSAGHLGETETIARVRTSFYWLMLTTDVKLFVKTCATYNANKKVTRPKTHLKSCHASFPLERVHIDILGPFSPSDQNNVYVQSMIDQFTKWQECAALPDQMAKQVVQEFVRNFIATFGYSLTVHSDQGSEVERDLFQSLCQTLEINKTRTTPYHPSSNEQVERYNRVILQMIPCCI